MIKNSINPKCAIRSSAGAPLGWIREPEPGRDGAGRLRCLADVLDDGDAAFDHAFLGRSDVWNYEADVGECVLNSGG
jgi:hypothetical protein